MNISMKSWHYRLNYFWAKRTYDIPESLCPYFWDTVLSVIKTIVLTIFALLVSTLLWKFLSWWLPSLSIYWSEAYESSFGAWCIAGIIIISITHAHVEWWVEENSEWQAGYGKILLTSRPWWLWEIKLQKKTAKPHQPGAFSIVVMGYIQALHDKVCPTIKFVDE